MGTEAAGASPRMEAYFATLEREAQRALSAARAARRQGFDPSLDVEIPIAQDLAARVEYQVEIAGIADLVRRLTLELKDRELVALEACRRVARGDLRKFSDPATAIDKAVRVGLSILTEGVLVAPLEGVAKVLIGRNADGTDYCDLYFAGPIRAAGGTAQAMSVLFADVVRRDLGVGRFIATEAEIERYKEEVPAYKQAQHLQYIPEAHEIETIVRHCPVCINGEGTEKVEVTGHRDLPRVETNQLRGGAVLVLAEGLTQKAAKIMKHVGKLGLKEWAFLEQFAKKKSAPSANVDALSEIESSDKFIRELIAGRPVFSHPSRPGGFRLRYGRGRTCGIASTAIHPVAMHALDEFLAVGTQMKLERPGKGTIATPCESLDPPLVLLKDGELRPVATVTEWNRVRTQVQQITDLGDILIPFGEFAENNAILPDATFTREWWRECVRAKAGDAVAEDLAARADVPFEQALQLSRDHGVPLHPDHTLLWHDVEVQAVRALRNSLLASARLTPEGLEWARNDADKKTLIDLACPHREHEGRFCVPFHGPALLACVGLVPGDGGVEAAQPEPAETAFASARFPSLAYAALNLGVEIKPRAPSRVGARMGRPEKADLRKMDPAVHGLFSLGEAGGIGRDLVKTAPKKLIDVEVNRRRCRECGRDATWPKCPCGGHTELEGEPEVRKIPIGAEYDLTLRRLNLRRAPEEVKGVKGLISKHKVPEALAKGVLRAEHEVFTFKDGTIRFDLTDAPLTHFRPAEIGTPVQRLVELGYTEDVHGAPLERPDQVLELRVQDVIPSRSCGTYFVKVARYVDDLLERLYEQPRFYNVSRAQDLVGHLVAGLAPHTSGAVLARIIGFTDNQVCWAHPFFHTGKRRNADGDEDALLLLMDAFLNFSKAFIPDRRGGLMDLPLVLSLRIDPREIDKEAHNLDVLWRYPLEFYQATEKHLSAKDVAKKMGLVEARLGTPSQYEGFGFTHDTPNIGEGPKESSYKSLGSMVEKMERQMALAERLRAVDPADVAGRVLSTHLLPDILGNLKSFAKQSIRCTKCNSKYRRAPLGGICTHLGAGGKVCGNELTLTVPQAGVRKYLDLSLRMSEKYAIPSYTKERVRLAQKFVEASFAPERFRDKKLLEFG